jgi:phosphoribosyl-ATP pyrophosphohydrolase
VLQLRDFGPEWQGSLEVMTTFNDLFELIESRKNAPSENSRTSELLSAGVHEIGKKVVEEAAETWMAAEYESNESLALEASQLIYHLQVLLVAKGISLEELEEKL